jgi:hypothetical protein
MSQLATVSSFVEGAPPGEVSQTTTLKGLFANISEACRCHSRYEHLYAIIDTITEALLLDIKALTVDSPNLVSQLGPAFEKYNEEQFATVKLPGSSQHVRTHTR